MLKYLFFILAFKLLLYMLPNTAISPKIVKLQKKMLDYFSVQTLLGAVALKVLRDMNVPCVTGHTWFTSFFFQYFCNIA